MASIDWHHNFRLDRVMVVSPKEDDDSEDYEAARVVKRADSSAEVGQEICTLSANEALALGDLLRLWAQGAMARKERSRG